MNFAEIWILYSIFAIYKVLDNIFWKMKFKDVMAYCWEYFSLKYNCTKYKLITQFFFNGKY